MWICLNKSFLSIVEPAAEERELHGDVLLVRARRPNDIQAVFGKAVKVEKRPERDYLFRTFLPRELVASTIAAEVAAIDYGNFKNSVKNDKLHDAFARIWSVMAALQPTRPYSGKSSLSNWSL